MRTGCMSRTVSNRSKREFHRGERVLMIPSLDSEEEHQMQYKDSEAQAQTAS